MKTWKYGEWALVAGAAEGLGSAYCRALAHRGINIILVDINTESMKKLSTELSHSVKTKELHVDLSNPASIEYIYEYLKNDDCRLLIYNAA